MDKTIQEELIEKQKLYPTIIKNIFDSYYGFSDFIEVKTYENIFCPFHQDERKPSARFFLDTDGIERIWCYVEKKQFTAYNYVKLILKKNPLTMLLQDVSEKELRETLKEFLANPNKLKTRKSKLANIDYKDMNPETFVELISLGISENSF